MTTLKSQDLHALGTRRVETILEGLLQAALALRSIPNEVYCPSARQLRDLVAAELDVLSTELRTRSAQRATCNTPSFLGR